ncbi:hypothetical protein AYI87_20135 [Shewanella sp. KCT]|nr:hypothetical protein AYI87_20135 [Shewanella sp. KCT]
MVKKTVTGSSIRNSPLIWSYKYSDNDGGYIKKGQSVPEKYKLKGNLPANVDAFLSDYILIKNPDGNSEKHYFNREEGSASEGKNIALEHINESGEIIRTELYYFKSSLNFGTLTGYYIPAWKNSTLTKKIIRDQNEYTTLYLDFNKFNQATTIAETGSSRRYIKKDLIHDEKSWILNLTKREYISKNKSFSNPYKEYSYNDKMLPKDEYLFGRSLKTKTYHNDGNLFRVTYSDSNKYEQFEDYYRGKARKITMPCPVNNECDYTNGSTKSTIIAKLEINPDGDINSVTDFKGIKTSYSYNLTGWLTKIDYEDPKWADKVISYATVTINDDGISGSNIAIGSLRQTISQGNYEKRIYHDALLRPVFTRERDTNDSSTIRYQTIAYDHKNRLTLSSFPSNNASNRKGMETEYDALGRIVTQTRTSDNSISRHEYLTGNRVAVTDGENNIITTTYLAYGEPSFDKPTLIEAPDSDDIAIEYNIFDQITSIMQGNVTENRFYDAYQQLCKQVRPETGISAFGYNTQRQQIWYARGTNGSRTSCDANAVPVTHKTLLDYDNLGQLRTENFPDTTPDKTYNYDANGNVISLIAGPVSWSYLYNSLNGLEKETLTLDGHNFVLDWEYNILGAISSLKYPSGTVVEFAPNALGQATKAGGYATGVSYYPNGQIKQFTYGNGIVRNVGLDTTGRIDFIKDNKGGVIKNSLDPSYDYNDNLTRLIDRLDRNNDVDNLTYDGLNRLKSADGKWGAGSYSYDGLGNILNRTFNNSTIGYKYNSLNRLNNLTGAYAYRYQYDARGNITHNGRYSLTYNLGQQMTSAKGVNYLYDGHNRRVKQTKADGNHYTIYSRKGQLLYRQMPDGSMTDSIYLGNSIVAETDHNIKFDGVNIAPVCKNVPIPGSRKMKKVCYPAKKSISWNALGAKSCSGTIERSINLNVSGTTRVTGTSGNRSFDRQYTLKTTITCTTNTNKTITESYIF